MFLYLSSTESRYKTQLGYGGIVFALDVLDTANMSGMSFNYSINDEIIIMTTPIYTSYVLHVTFTIN